ncbi:hypothetical protein D3C77_723050 [compost metagenome]
MLYADHDGPIKTGTKLRLTRDPVEYGTTVPNAINTSSLKVWLRTDTSCKGYTSGVVPGQLVKVSIDNKGRIRIL